MSIQAFNNHENKFVLKHYLIKHDEARTKVWLCIKVAIINGICVRNIMKSLINKEQL